MARPDQDVIDTFMNFTGVSEAVAVQKLEEHHGNLNTAVDAHFSQGDINRAQEALFTDPRDDFMDIDDAVQGESHRSPSPRHPFTGDLNPFSLDVPDRGTRISTWSPFIPHQRDASGASGRTGSAPVTDYGSETAHDHGPDIRGTVTLNESDDGRSITNAPIMQGGMNADQGSTVQTRSGAPTIVDLPDHRNDIEEAMLRAAIEASKQDVRYDHLGLGNPDPLPVQSQVEDVELAHAVSLSLLTAERENALMDPKESVGVSEHDAQTSASLEDMRKITSSNGRQSHLERGSSSALKESDDVELFRHQRRQLTSNSIDTLQNTEGVEISSNSSLPQNDNAQHVQRNGSDFPSDEWGGITSEEHDEALLLEAAMFGGVPEGTEFHFPDASHQLMQNGLDRYLGSVPRPSPRPPSPSLTAQRLIREEQDDEYLASLQADREKELKAKQEAEAALAEEKLKEEEFRRQLQQEEEIERQLAVKEASLPREPTPDDENAVTLLVRMPDGSRRGRRFHKSDKLQHLFDFIDVGRGVKTGSYRLVRPYPRRAFGDEEHSLTLNELGLISKQEALYLESI